MSDLKENGMSNGEVLAAVNKSSEPKIQKPQTFPGSKMNSLAPK
jgi:hypothetical protein